MVPKDKGKHSTSCYATSPLAPRRLCTQVRSLYCYSAYAGAHSEYVFSAIIGEEKITVKSAK